MMRSFRSNQSATRYFQLAAFYISLLLLLCHHMHAASPISFYGVTKAQRFAQTNANPPAALSVGGFRAEAFVFSSSTITASVRNPNNTARVLTNWDGHFVVSQLLDSWSAFTVAWPNGAYSLEMTNASDGPKKSTMSLSGDSYAPPAQIQNFSDGQRIDASQPFLLSWKPLSGAPTDLVYLRIEEQSAKIFETSPIPGTALALNCNATNVTIPANTLHPGRLYRCILQVWRTIGKDIFTVPGALGETAYVTETTVPLRTRFGVQDVLSYTIEKSASYEQLTIATPLPAQNPAEFSANVVPAGTNSLLSATVLAPNGTVCTLTGQPPSFSRTFASPALLASAFPAGGFTVRLDTRNDGLQTNTLSLSGDNYPGIPEVQNIDEAQFLNSAATFRLLFNVPTAVANDAIDLVISEGNQPIFKSALMSGSTNALDIPPGTILPGHSYRGTLRAFRTVTTDSDTYPLCAASAGFSRKTSFPLQARTGPPPQPSILTAVANPNRFEFTFSSVRGQAYLIQTATNAWHWAPLQTLTASDQTMRVAIPSPTLPISYYQVSIAP